MPLSLEMRARWTLMISNLCCYCNARVVYSGVLLLRYIPSKPCANLCNPFFSSLESFAYTRESLYVRNDALVSCKVFNYICCITLDC